MNILLDAYEIPEIGKVALKVDRSFEIKVAAEEARRKVNRWLLNEISYMIGADDPTLVIGNHSVVWRVPAWIGFPHTGRVGVVGTVDVDVQSGDMKKLADCKLEIKKNLAKLKPNLPPYQPHSLEESLGHLAQDVALAPKIVVTESGYLQVEGE